MISQDDLSNIEKLWQELHRAYNLAFTRFCCFFEAIPQIGVTNMKRTFLVISCWNRFLCNNVISINARPTSVEVMIEHKFEMSDLFSCFHDDDKN